MFQQLYSKIIIQHIRFISVSCCCSAIVSQRWNSALHLDKTLMVFQNFLLSLVYSLFLVFLYFIKMLVLDVLTFLAFLNKQLRLRICLMIFLVNHGCLPVLLGRYLCGIHSFIISRSLLVQSSVDSSTSSVSRPSQSVCSMRLLALTEFASLYIHTSLELEYLVVVFLQVLL